MHTDIHPAGALISFADRNDAKRRAETAGQVAKLNKLIAAALHWRAQIERHPTKIMHQNEWVLLDFIEAGAAIADNWSEWAVELRHSLEGEG